MENVHVVGVTNDVFTKFRLQPRFKCITDAIVALKDGALYRDETDGVEMWFDSTQRPVTIHGCDVVPGWTIRERETRRSNWCEPEKIRLVVCGRRTYHTPYYDWCGDVVKPQAAIRAAISAWKRQDVAAAQHADLKTALVNERFEALIWFCD